jgi:phosphoglycolate phosphatase-like HAD superfamily hydrolase
MALEGAVIFDADGTLADSLPPHVAFCRMMNEELKAGLLLPETSDLDGCRALAAAPMDNFLRRAGFAGSDVDTAVQRYERSFAEEFPVGLFDGVPAMLRMLVQARDQGLRMAVVSSNTSKNVRACLAQHSGPPLASCFEFIWGIDNAARSKAESLAHAAAEMGLTPQQIVYVGDTEKDARCAQACGMHFIGADWGGFEDMGRLASAAASAEGVEGLAPYTAVQSPSAVPAEALRLIQSSAKISPKNLSCDPRSPRSVEQGHAKPQSDALSPYDAAGWWSFLWFSWMTPLYDKKGEDLKLELDAEVAFADWSTPRRDAPEAQAAKLQVRVSAALVRA